MSAGSAAPTVAVVVVTYNSATVLPGLLRSLDDGFIPPIIDLSLLDRKIFVTNHDAIVWTRRLLDEEGIFAGVSSGAIASIAAVASGARPRFVCSTTPVPLSTGRSDGRRVVASVSATAAAHASSLVGTTSPGARARSMV